MFKKWHPKPNLLDTYFPGALHLHGPSAKQIATFINTNVQNKLHVYNAPFLFQGEQNTGKRGCQCIQGRWPDDSFRILFLQTLWRWWKLTALPVGHELKYQKVLVPPLTQMQLRVGG